MKYLSHPTQKLTTHISNIQAYDREDSLFVKAVLFHDLGKVLDSFQAYIQKQRKDSEPHAPISGIIYLLNQVKEDLKIAKDDLFIFNAIISHHGILKSFCNREGSHDILEFFTKEIATENIEEIYRKKDVLEYLNLKEIDTKNFRKLKRKNKKLRFDVDDFVTQKLLFSKLIFADKYEAIYKSSHQKKENKQSQSLLHKRLDEIIKHKDSKRDEVKNSILNAYDKNYNIFTLTAPTGIGKTLTSLELALKIKEEKSLEKIIYILPFTSIIDQTYEIFNKLFPNKITKHHYAVTFEDTQENNRAYDRWKFILNAWDEPFIISTLYQLFFALFSNKNSDNIKFQALQNTVIVLDEVQAIPFDLWKVFKSLLPVLAQKLNTTFILMSATMPILIDKTEALELVDKKAVFEEKNRYVLKYLDVNDLEILADVIIAEFKEGKSVLCVVNTIKRSKLLYKLVQETLESLGNDGFSLAMFGAKASDSEQICKCLNSYMFFEDRKEVIRTIKEKDNNNVMNKILISTQVIEAGVDLDFDVGFREFAPISSIIQTAGRVNREGKKGLSSIYIFESKHNIYDPIMMSESRKTFLEPLQNSLESEASAPNKTRLKPSFPSFPRTLKEEGIEEKDILTYVEAYFNALDANKGDTQGMLDDIEIFDFNALSKKNRDAFGLEAEHIKSVAVGVDLKSYELDYFESSKGLKPYELKQEKEKIMREFQTNILNIKEKDLNATGMTIEHSDIFGLFYIIGKEGIYSKESGFLIEEERGVDDAFDF